MRPPLASLLLAAPLLAAPLPALAGGIGLVTTGGGHLDNVYGYEQNTVTGEWSQKVSETQLGPNFGGGLEVVLGDRDNRTLGVFRVFYLQDAPQQPVDGYVLPAEGATKVSPVRDVPLHNGVITGGLQWGLLGDPTALQLTVVADLGAGLFTEDLTMFITGDAGVGGTWMPDRRIQVAASLTGGGRIGGVRYRGTLLPTGNAYVGVRYLFD